MRKFLNTLYVLNKDAYLSLEGENIVLLCNKAEIGRVPLHTLEGIVCFSYPGASPALMGKCTSLGVDLSFFSPQGRFLARAVGEERGNVLLRQTQYRIADSEAESCLYARNFILGKVYNARWVLERATRDHPQRVPVEQLKRTSAQLAAALPLIEQCDDLDQLRGLEGEAAQRYFDCFDSLILQQHDDFAFTGRSRRPPLDNTNALLSFAYSLLASGSSECGPRPLCRLSPPRPARAQEPRPRPHGRAACSLCRPLRALLHQPENHDAEAFPEAGERGRPSHR